MALDMLTLREGEQLPRTLPRTKTLEFKEINPREWPHARLGRLRAVLRGLLSFPTLKP